MKILIIFFLFHSLLFNQEIELVQKNEFYDYTNVVDTIDGNTYIKYFLPHQNGGNGLYCYLYKNNAPRDVVFVSVGELVTNENLEKVKLDNNTNPTFIRIINHFGSTFGAFKHIIVWHDGNYWRITKTPFIWAELVDVNKDGIYEFHELYNEDQYDEPRIYSFVNGGFIPFKSK